MGLVYLCFIPDKDCCIFIFSLYNATNQFYYKFETRLNEKHIKPPQLFS
jgi:hypothetical protein